MTRETRGGLLGNPDAAVRLGTEGPSPRHRSLARRIQPDTELAFRDRRPAVDIPLPPAAWAYGRCFARGHRGVEQGWDRALSPGHDA